MSMSTGGGGGLQNEPNVTPMIDVLMVLLIIFMVIVPTSRKAMDVQLPDPTPQPGAPNTSQIVLEVLPGGQYAINKQPVSAGGLNAKLHEVYDTRPDKIIFVKGHPNVTYQDVIGAMDAARGAGVKVIGVPPKDANM